MTIANTKEKAQPVSAAPKAPVKVIQKTPTHVLLSYTKDQAHWWKLATPAPRKVIGAKLARRR